MYYADFTSSPVQPLKINMIRHPVERFISHFNYRHNGDQISESVEISNYTIDECILNNFKECEYIANYMIPFFCGQEKLCRKGTKESFEIARDNLVNEYAFIGITEHFEDVITILEKLVPSFFGGLSQKWMDFG